MDPDEVLLHVTQLLASLKGPVAGALLTGALSEQGSQFRLATARFEFRRTPIDARPALDYERIVLAEEWLEGPTAVARLQALLRGEGSIGPRVFGAQFHSMHAEERRLPEAQSITGWSEWVVNLRLREDARANLPYRPLLRSRLRPYSRDVDAIAQWVWPGVQGGSEPFKGQILIIVPDFRGRFRELEWTPDSRLRVTVEGTLPPEDLEAQAICRVDRSEVALEHRQPEENAGSSGRHVAWTVPENASSVEVFLIDPAENELLDRADAHPLISSAAHPRAATPEQRAAVDLLGESHEVEFKPFIQPSHEKERELLASVIAFANTNDGRLYVGVSKDGVPESRAALWKASGREMGDAERSYKAYVDRLIHERVKPLPKFTSEFIKVFGESVLVVTVSRGDGRPYSTNPGNDVYIRSGATNRRPDPHTEWPAQTESTVTGVI